MALTVSLDPVIGSTFWFFFSSFLNFFHFGDALNFCFFFSVSLTQYLARLDVPFFPFFFRIPVLEIFLVKYIGIAYVGPVIVYIAPVLAVQI
jgi:hypothetical protein